MLKLADEGSDMLLKKVDCLVTGQGLVGVCCCDSWCSLEVKTQH